MFCVVYHETVDYNVTKEQILGLKIPVCTDPELDEYSPVWYEAGFDIVPHEVYMPSSNVFSYYGSFCFL